MMLYGNFLTCSCGACWPVDQTCEAAFHQFLYWENENIGVGEKVHALMVLCYHLQHPHILSQDWLTFAGPLLRDLVEGELEPAEIRRRMSGQVDSGRRQWKIKPGTGEHGRYEHPIRWRMTAADVFGAGKEAYGESINRWAQSTLADLRDNSKGELRMD